MHRNRTCVCVRYAATTTVDVSPRYQPYLMYMVEKLNVTQQHSKRHVEEKHKIHNRNEIKKLIKLQQAASVLRYGPEKGIT